jgi:hypothetical protein
MFKSANRRRKGGAYQPAPRDVVSASRSVPAETKEGPMAFIFKLEHEEGRPQTRPFCKRPCRTGAPGDTIPLTADRALRVVEIRASTADENRVLVVEPA